mmetsp:Transcript_119273/g.210710  ORF Transcript_119273/g.210710 Transcript_119273/m.210710 type:complete len:278 (-) Transcript_119273:148-981(-)
MSTASLPLASDKPKTMIKSGMLGLSRSSPALAAAFNLRQYAEEHQHVPPSRPRSTGKIIPIEKIDLLGGNGRWRQRKATEEFERRRLEELERMRLEKIRQEERRRKQAEIAERKRRHQIEEERRWQEEREQKRQDQLMREKAKREAEEKERLRREEEERERLRRLPKTCETCDGTGKCQVCMGKGFYFSMYLVNKVDEDTLLDFGRQLQGCGNCGGYAQGITGEVKKGTGKCPACNGTGKIWPVIDGDPTPTNRGRGVAASWNIAGYKDLSPSALEY